MTNIKLVHVSASECHRQGAQNWRSLIFVMKCIFYFILLYSVRWICWLTFRM